MRRCGTLRTVFRGKRTVNDGTEDSFRESGQNGGEIIE